MRAKENPNTPENTDTETLLRLLIARQEEVLAQLERAHILPSRLRKRQAIINSLRHTLDVYMGVILS